MRYTAIIAILLASTCFASMPAPLPTLCAPMLDIHTPPRFEVASSGSRVLEMMPKGPAKYEQLLKLLHNKYGGTTWLTSKDWPYTSGPNAGVAPSLMGLYPGAISGTTYYNTVTVTGTLSPNATGTYTAAGMYGGLPYYYGGVVPHYIYKVIGYTAWVIRPTLGSGNSNYWQRNEATWVGDYPELHGTDTGTATVANVPASGIYLFVPSGVTLQSPGPIIAGQTAKSAAFDGTAGNILIPYTSASTSHTFGCWVYFPTQSYVNNFLFDSYTGRLVFGFSSNTYKLAISDGAWREFGYTPTQNVWHHLAFVCDGIAGKCRLFSDGVQQGTDQTYTSKSIGGSVRIGSSYDGSVNLIKASLAYASVFPAALRPDEVLALCNAGRYGQ